MNIKDFLMENYIYIIIIIVLVIITIIGFLADKKKNGDKRPNTMGGNIQPGMGGNNMPYQPQQPNVNMPINYGQANGVAGNNMQYNPVANTPPISPLPITPVGPENGIAPQPINNVVTPAPVTPIAPIGPVPEPMNMQPVPNQTDGMNYNAPGPVEPLNVAMNNPSEALYQPLSEQKPSFTPVEPNVNMMNNQMAPSAPEPMINQVPIQPISPEPMNMQPAAAPMPNPMPAQPMPNQGGNTIPNPITPPQPVSPEPINFTYGNQNNNGFMQ